MSPSAPGDLLLLQTETLDSAPTRDTPRRTLLLRRTAAGAWSQTSYDGANDLLRVASESAAASWRSGPTPPPRLDGDTSYYIDAFRRAEAPDEKPLDWRATLRRLPANTRAACRGAVAMLEVDPPEGNPALLAVGPRALCRSTNKGVTFTPIDAPLTTPDYAGTPPGDLSAALAFPHADAASGVRLLIALHPVHNPLAQQGRITASRLFLSDDLGRTWQDVTPDIEGPGAFLDLEATRDPAGQVHVWLLTARRGLYRSTQAGLGFVRQSQGLEAAPLYALAQDPRYPDIIWAASPTGIYRFGGLWTRETPQPARSVASRLDPWQLWIGTWYGQLRRRTPDGPFLDEPIAPPPPADPTQPTPPPTSRLRALHPELPPRLTATPDALRPVTHVLPAGAAQDAEAGFVHIEGEGLWTRRPDGAWDHLPDPFPPEAQEVDLLAITPLIAPPERPGLLLFTQRHDGSRYRVEAWRWHPDGAWTTLALPEDLLPSAAIEIDGALWIANATGGLLLASIQGDALKIRRTDLPDLPCAALARGPDRSVLCAAPPPPGSRDALLTFARVNPSPADNIAPHPLTAPNPYQRPRLRPLSIAASRNVVGDHLWVTAGLGAYASPLALTPILPPEPSQPWYKSVPWIPVLIALGALLAVIALLYLLKQTSRFFKPWFDLDL